MQIVIYTGHLDIKKEPPYSKRMIAGVVATLIQRLVDPDYKELPDVVFIPDGIFVERIGVLCQLNQRTNKPLGEKDLGEDLAPGKKTSKENPDNRS